MRRTVFALTAIVLVAAATGCRMCAHPFDYCGPTFTGGNCGPCNPDARAGSILSPTIPTTVGGGQVTPEEVVGPTEEQTAPSDDYLSQEPAASNRAAAGTRVMWR
jgi:hypothetical protein